jgi:uncharacterized coiled-coil DUF342 family protein
MTKGWHIMDKETYQKKLHAQLDQWQAEIDKLQAQAREASADMQGKYQEQIRDLRERRDHMEAEYRKIQAASAQAWQDFKTGADKAWDEMATAMKAAWSRFG